MGAVAAVPVHKKLGLNPEQGLDAITLWSASTSFFHQHFLTLQKINVTQHLMDDWKHLGLDGFSVHLLFSAQVSALLTVTPHGTCVVVHGRGQL